VSENIILGLISGLLATFLVFVFRSIWNCILVPWFEERVYKDIKIEGTWFSLYPASSDNRQEVITLKRQGHAVKGEIVCLTGGDLGERYQVTGSFRNMLLPLSYESSDVSKADRGAITLQSIHNGERLSGKMAYYNTSQDTISTANVIWFRHKNDVENLIAQKVKHKERIEQLNREAQNIEKELQHVEDVTDRDNNFKKDSNEPSAKTQ